MKVKDMTKSFSSFGFIIISLFFLGCGASSVGVPLSKMKQPESHKKDISGFINSSTEIHEDVGDIISIVSAPGDNSVRVWQERVSSFSLIVEGDKGIGILTCKVSEKNSRPDLLLFTIRWRGDEDVIPERKLSN
jgi:hypothetical protein